MFVKADQRSFLMASGCFLLFPLTRQTNRPLNIPISSRSAMTLQYANYAYENVLFTSPIWLKHVITLLKRTVTGWLECSHALRHFSNQCWWLLFSTTLACPLCCEYMPKVRAALVSINYPKKNTKGKGNNRLCPFCCFTSEWRLHVRCLHIDQLVKFLIVYSWLRIRLYLLAANADKAS